MNYSNSQRAGVILYLTALLFGAYILNSINRDNIEYNDFIYWDWEYAEPLPSSTEVSSSEAAYKHFIEKVAPDYLDSETEPTLEEIVLNYLSVHPDASFADEIGLSGITTEYDSEIDEVSEKIASLEDSNSTLNTELAELSELQSNHFKYEERYNTAKKNALSSFSATVFIALTAGLLVTFLISCSLVSLDYLKKRKTMFQIQYAGGCIAFDVSYFAKAEIDDFQKQLRRTKDLAEGSASKITIAEPPVQPPVQTTAQNSVPDDLRKYADLLKEGLISQEEYDAMKKKILGL